MTPDLKQLISKLNDTCKRTLEGAAGLCLSRTNYNVEIEHWLLKLLEVSNLDLEHILKAFDIEPSRFAAELTRGVDGFKTGNSRSPALSPNLVDLMRDAWLFASVDFASHEVRSGHLLYAILAQDSLRRSLSNAVKSLDQISVEQLKSKFHAITERSAEENSAPPASAGGGGNAAPTRTATKGTVALDQYTIDLTAKARAGKIDPVLGRDWEVRQVVDVLCRRRQNNPILTGEPGVGKTAVAEGFALKIAAGDVPDAIKNVSLRTLDLGLLQAGAGVKGEFENRLKSVIEEVQASPQPIILFIDEAHTMIGAGGQAGQGDAANLLKPALARGELRTIAATTWAEYKKYFERDAALARRFQVIKVEEPNESDAIDMMRGIVETLEKHHGVEVLSDAVEDAVRLSKRYIAGRQLPDKSVSLLDTTCARINLSQNSTPPAIEDNQRQIDQIGVLKQVLHREMAAGSNHSERLQALDADLEKLSGRRDELQEQWSKEQQLVQKIQSLRKGQSLADENGESQPLSPEEQGEQLRVAEGELRSVQGKHPLIHPYVDTHAVAETIESWTGIPVGKMVADEVQTLLKLDQAMQDAVVGQDHAMRQIAQSIQTSRAKLTDPRTPIGVFLLAGTSGVGKTETAVTLANLLYGGETNMTVINMSEFKEEHKVSLLMGSPPGYVGYGEGGVLTEAVRRKPYSVVLLDEMEKAHPGVQDIFYQVFDKGQMKDGEGRDIDFRNTIILMTSNAGTDFIKNLCADEDTIPEPQAFAEAVYPELLKTFKPAFLGRCTIVPYYPLRDSILRQIADLKLRKLGKLIREHHKASFSWTDELLDEIVARCTEVDTGARNIDLILRRTLLPELSSRILARLGEQQTIDNIEVSLQDQEFAYNFR
ncbi:MAG TPA: type VI secretion system ATPase TssH [Planctomicrobium sp.]|nr:type VI secretion system ATPase TssH [Planctomicrobium sp.]